MKVAPTLIQHTQQAPLPTEPFLPSLTGPRQIYLNYHTNEMFLNCFDYSGVGGQANPGTFSLLKYRAGLWL